MADGLLAYLAGGMEGDWQSKQILEAASSHE